MNRKKLSGIVAVLVVAAGVAAWLAARSQSPAPVAAADPASLHPGRMALTAEAGEVFRRAFWKRPDPSDKILHAERREWTEAADAGISRWQWFLAVEPGPELVKWLREDNAFGLRPAAGVEAPRPPAWFPRETRGFTIVASRNPGGLTLLFSPDNRTLYATAAGKGFAGGAPEPPKPAVASAPAAPGRLPAAPPPAHANPR